MLMQIKHIIVLQIFVLISLIKCEYFTAITDMKILLEIENQIIEHISTYIESQENQINHIEDIFNKSTIGNQISLTAKSNRIKTFNNKFNIQKRLNRDWRHIFEIISQENNRESQLKQIESLKEDYKFPTHDDLEGAAVALARLTKTYRLNTSDLADGKIKNVQYNTGFSVNDLFEIGFLTISTKDALSSEWISEALKRFNSTGTDSDDTLKHDILNYLVEAFKEEENYISAIETIDRIIEMYPDKQMLAPKKFQLNLKLKELGKNPFDVKKQQINMMDKQIEKYDVPYEHIDDPFDIDEFQRILYEATCRGETKLSPKILAPLRCRYMTNKIPFLKIAPFKLEEISLDPYIVLYHNVISDAEIEMIKKDTKPQLERASVESYEGDRPVASYIKQRVSKAAWLDDEHDDYMVDLTQRMADVTGQSMENAELLQIVNYGMGGYYDMHFDFALDDDVSFEERGIGNRISTLMFYMSDVAEGGATAFPLIKTAVFPIKGSAVFWHNLYASGQVDPRTKHSGCPVLVGNKWVSNKWIHLYDQSFIFPCKLYPDHLKNKIYAK